jgi:2-iminobutanoate/2-iminopropanoate deaminase
VTGDTVGEQTQIALDNVAAVLESAGAGLADVVQCRVFLADTAHFRAMDEAYSRIFAEPRPARTTVGVALPLPGMLVEIDCVAVLPATGGGA